MLEIVEEARGLLAKNHGYLINSYIEWNLIFKSENRERIIANSSTNIYIIINKMIIRT